MTKNEVKALIRKKMETTERDYFECFAKKDFDNCTYYQGINQGLQDVDVLLHAVGPCR